MFWNFVSIVNCEMSSRKLHHKLLEELPQTGSHITRIHGRSKWILTATMNETVALAAEANVLACLDLIRWQAYKRYNPSPTERTRD